MRPILKPTLRLIVCFGSALIVAALGQALSVNFLWLLGSLVVSWIALVFAIRPRTDYFQRVELHFSWQGAPVWVEDGSAAAVLQLSGHLFNHGDRDIYLRRVQPLLSIAGHQPTIEPCSVRVRCKDRTPFTFSFEPTQAGVLFVHGLRAHVLSRWAFCETPIYFPKFFFHRMAPLAKDIEYLQKRIQSANLDTNAVRSRDLHNYSLREHQLGDPAARIQWKVSAKRNRIYVKSPRAAEPREAWVVVDVGSDGFWPERSAHIVQISHRIADAYIQAQVMRRIKCRVVMTHERILASTAISSLSHLAELSQLLSFSFIRTDEDLTDIGFQELAHQVGSYLRVQEQLPLFGTGVLTGRNITQILQYLSTLTYAPPADGSLRASSADSQLLRRFCWSRGLRLPARKDEDGERSVSGILAALSDARRALPDKVTVICDLGRIRNATRLVHGLSMLGLGRHQVTFLCPRDAHADGGFASLYAMARRREQAARRLLELGGVRVESFDFLPLQPEADLSRKRAFTAIKANAQLSDYRRTG